MGFIFLLIRDVQICHHDMDNSVVLVMAKEWPEESNDYTSMKDARGRI